jgi:hypothetical protein
MKRILIASSLVAAIGIGGVAYAAASGAAVSRPGLFVQETGPLTVRGFNFDSAEHVTVSARTGGTLKVAARVVRTATAKGGFVAVFSGVQVSDCEGYAVTAVGSDGSRASTARRPGVCAPGPE